jgi:hypothetical protein
LEWDGFAVLMHKRRSSQKDAVTKLEDHLGVLDVEGVGDIRVEPHQARHCTYDVTLRRVRATIAAGEKQ